MWDSGHKASNMDRDSTICPMESSRWGSGDKGRKCDGSTPNPNGPLLSDSTITFDFKAIKLFNIRVISFS